MKFPSKELLSEVLSKEVEEERFIDSNSLIYVNSGMYFDINVYELAHKCKEWAFDKFGIQVSSEIGEDSKVDKFWTANFKLNDEHYSFWALTEPEAIFKACEWIMGRTK